MQRNYNSDVLSVIDKNAYKEAYGVDLGVPEKYSENEYEQTSNQSILKEKSFMDRVWPEMQPIPKGFAHSDQLRKQLEELTNAAAGAPGMQVAGRAAVLGKELGKKAYEYISPSKIAEEGEKFRQSLGSTTERENVENISKRVQFAKKSGEKEALIPKRELYSQEGRSDVYKVKPESLPEGNLPKLAHMIEPGTDFEKEQQHALSKALNKYRKNGNVESFIENSEDIFGIPELSPKAASKIEDALLLPTKRESSYLSDSDVTSYYGKKGKIRQLHDNYASKPTLNHYDALQSALKKEERALARREKKGTIGDVAQAKLDQTRVNIANIEEDASKFFETLPENMKELQRTFSKKWATGPATYADADITLRRLASGKPGELGKVNDSQIIKLFTNPDEKTLASLKEMGPSVGSNVIYSALNKIGPGKTKEMAELIIDLKRKKGFDSFITPDMEAWAKNMVKRAGRAELAKKGLLSMGGAAAGSVLGPFGAIGGAALPFAKDYIKIMPKYLQKKS